MDIIIFYLIVLIFSVVIHEVSHGSVALMLGDPTAKDANRLTLNPLRHIDIFGLVILPLITFFAWGFPIGAAKPVPYNPYKLRNQRYGSAIVGAAGPGANLLLVLIFGTLLRFIASDIFPFYSGFVIAFSVIVQLNLYLAIFNLLPIPPLDGSKIFVVFLPNIIRRALDRIGHQVQPFTVTYWPFLLIALFWFGPRILVPILGLVSRIVAPIYNFFGGIPL